MVQALREDQVGTWEEVLWWDSWDEVDIEADGPEDSRYCDGCGVYVGSHGVWQFGRLVCLECMGEEEDDPETA